MKIKAITLALFLVACGGDSTTEPAKCPDVTIWITLEADTLSQDSVTYNDCRPAP